MSDEIKQKILKWISDNHNYHEDTENSYRVSECVEQYSPYVNSLELEKFIKSLSVGKEDE